MNLNKRLARLENLAESTQTINPYMTKRYQLISKANSQLTVDEKFRGCQCLKNWEKNGNSWAGIESDEQEFIKLINLGLSRLAEKKLKNADC